jgi:surface protein
MLGLGLKINKASAVPSYFISSWKTDNTSSGSSTDHQVKLPLESSGTYDFYVDWGDGVVNHITAYNQAEVTHPYSAIGTYPIKIRGVCTGFRFNNGGDKLKLLEISNWGDLLLGASDGQFYGCSNLKIIAKDVLKNTGILTIASMYRGCAVTVDIGKLDTVHVFSMNSAFNGCNAMNSSYISNFNTINVVGMSSMFYLCYVFNQPVPFNTLQVTTMASMFELAYAFNQSVSSFNTEKVTTMAYMFRNCYVFNQSVSNFNTAKVTTMAYMFNGCSAFNQDISMWNIEAVANMTNMFTGATAWSTENYDKFLISAAAQDVQTGIQFDCETKYTAGGAAEAARSYLQTTKIWNIVDGGAA